MTSATQSEGFTEPELAALICPSCAAEIDQAPWPLACPNCQGVLDLPAQFAYCRGLDAFTVGQELLFKIPPGQRKKTLITAREMEGLQYYQQAYTSLQQAFQGELAESQRRLAIEMMSAMAHVFRQHGIISPAEAYYWTALFTELKVQAECLTVREKLIHPGHGGLLGLALHWRWQARLRQLEQGLQALDERIRFLERGIAFVERPRARRRPVKQT